MGTTVVVVTHAREIVDQFAKRVVAIDGGMVVSDRTGGYYQRPDVTKITQAAVQQAAATARRRQVLAQELGVAVEPQAEEIPAEAPVREEARPEEEMPRETVFNIDDLLHFDEQENGGRA
jgi:ABC-type methionine transport system ATPase subunit